MSSDQENTNFSLNENRSSLINKPATKKSSQTTQISQNIKTFKRKRQRRIEWTKEELDELEKGMEKFGTNWTLILDMSSGLRNRTNVQLKDKARNEKRRREREGEPLGVFQKATG